MCNINTPFLHTGLYRWFRNLTQSAVMARGLVAVLPITASEDLHLALKQTFYLKYDIVKNRWKTFFKLFSNTLYKNRLGKSSLFAQILCENIDMVT